MNHKHLHISKPNPCDTILYKTQRLQKNKLMKSKTDESELYFPCKSKQLTSLEITLFFFPH